MKTLLLSLVAALVCGSALVADDGMKLIVWNQHNATGGDRGTKTFTVELLRGSSVVWKKEAIEIPWTQTTDEKVEVNIPKQIFAAEKLRITINDYHGLSGGFSEVEIIRDGVNIAPKSVVSVSSTNGKWYPATRLIDGITSSAKRYTGYWIPAEAKGWAEFILPPKVASKASH